MPSPIESLLILNNLSLNPKNFLSLIQHFGSASRVLEATEEQLTPFLGTKSPKVRNWLNEKGWQNDLKAVEKENISLVTFEDPNYPPELLKLGAPPPLLYVKGSIECLKLKKVAIIGTRTASIYGKELARICAKEIASQNFCVVSGMARGIDTAAHLGAVNDGITIGVIGSGLSFIYPQENQSLALKISEKGALISEYPMHTSPTRYTFPQRNRLIAGLCFSLILAESPLKGGSMITMQIGQDLKKTLFAFPARIDMPSFQGNHYLIKKGVAHLIEDAKDLPFIAEFSYPSKNSFAFSEEENHLLMFLGGKEKTLDELVLLTQFPIMKLNVLLIRLMIKKMVKEFPGKVYKKNF